MIALLGNLARDFLPGLPPRTGGAPFHAARAFQQLGTPAVIYARCAIDDRAELLPPLVALGTPVRYVPGEHTAGFEISYEGDHRLDDGALARRHLAPRGPARARG